MAAHETLNDLPNAEEPKEDAKVSPKGWAWVVGGLVIGYIMLWNQHREDLKTIAEKNAEIISIYKESANESRAQTVLSEQLRLASEQLNKRVNDSIAHYRADLSESKQPGRSE